MPPSGVEVLRKRLHKKVLETRKFDGKSVVANRIEELNVPLNRLKKDDSPQMRFHVIFYGSISGFRSTNDRFRKC